MNPNTYPKKRYKKTLQFLKKHVPPPANILDLGAQNPFSEIMKEHQYKVSNTQGEDLDITTDRVKKKDFEVVTAFEILEHLVAPYNLLKAIEAKKLVVTIPLRLWFSSSYRNLNDPWDNHFHEFEAWQFDWLLEKSGWIIKDCEKWTNPSLNTGFRPLLRYFTPRYYAVYAERKS